MTLNDDVHEINGDRTSSPVHVHVDNDTPVHVHVKKNRSRATVSRFAVEDSKTAGLGNKTGRPKRPGSVSAQQRSRGNSPSATGVRWVPPPGKSSRAFNFQNIQDGESDVERENVEGYERRVKSLLSEVGQLKAEADLEKTLREKSEKEKDLALSRRSLADTRAQLNMSANENHNLRKSLEQLQEQVNANKSGDSWTDSADESLMRKLVEAELDSQEVSRMTSILADQARTLKELRVAPSSAQSNALRQIKEQLLAKLADFDSSNVKLRRLLRERHEEEARRGRLTDQRDALLSELSQQIERTRLAEEDLGARERHITDLMEQLARRQTESVCTLGHVNALESNCGHLQQQLRLREADCNRMAVQIRALESQLAQEKIDNAQLSDLLRDSKERIEQEKESLKKAARVHKERAVRSEDSAQQLAAKLAERDAQVAQLDSEVKHLRSRVEQVGREKSVALADCVALRDQIQEAKEKRLELNGAHHASEKVQLCEANEQLKKTLRSVEDMLMTKENELIATRGNLHRSESANEQNRQQLDAQNKKMDALFEKLRNSKEEYRQLKARFEEQDRKLLMSDERQRDLSSNLAKQEEFLNTAQARLDEKSRENAALMRQLENALAEARRGTDSTREKALARERQLQARILDAESQLAASHAETARARRDKDEAERKCSSRINDFKERLEQAHATNRSIQNYVQFLKKSYANVFGDSALSPTLGLNGSAQFSNASQHCTSPLPPR